MHDLDARSHLDAGPSRKPRTQRFLELWLEERDELGVTVDLADGVRASVVAEDRRAHLDERDRHLVERALGNARQLDDAKCLVVECDRAGRTVDLGRLVHHERAHAVTTEQVRDSRTHRPEPHDDHIEVLDPHGTRPIAMITHSAAITAAGATRSPSRTCVRTAPAISTNRHTAATDVSSGAIPVAAGTISPNAPASSASPSILMRARGHVAAQCIRFSSCSRGSLIFVAPTSANTTAVNTCATQSITFNMPPS
jgi:hypothetical protein